MDNSKLKDKSIIMDNNSIIFIFFNTQKKISIFKDKLGNKFKFFNFDKKLNKEEYIIKDNEIHLYDLFIILKNNTLLFKKENLQRNDIKKYIDICLEYNFPYWILEKLFEIKIYNQFLMKKIKDTFNNEIKLCKICGKGFKESENKPNSCKVHREKLKYPFEYYSCCGVTKEQGMNNPCSQGYHFEDKEQIIKNLSTLSYKILEFL